MNWILHLLFLTNRLQQRLKRDPSSPAPVPPEGVWPLCQESPKAQGPATAQAPRCALVDLVQACALQRPVPELHQLPLCHPPPRDPLELKTGCALRPVPLTHKLDVSRHGFSGPTQIHFSSWATSPPGVSAVALRKVLCCVSLGKSLPSLSTQLLTWGWK